MTKENMMKSDIPLFISDGVGESYSERLKARFSVFDCAPEGHDIYLLLGADGLSLNGADGSIRADFSSMTKRIRHDNLSHELLIKAAKIKDIDGTPTILDATAGLGEDSFLLAAAGYNVILFEKDAVIAALLKDALTRAEKDEQICEIAGRMTLYETDSISAMRSGEYKPDIIFLDPMFPERRKSAMIKKKFQLLQKLEMPCSDENELLNAALFCGAKRIIIKRPKKSPFLGGKKPSYSIDGSTIRYDCIVL